MSTTEESKEELKAVWLQLSKKARKEVLRYARHVLAEQKKQDASCIAEASAVAPMGRDMSTDEIVAQGGAE